MQLLNKENNLSIIRKTENLLAHLRVKIFVNNQQARICTLIQCTPLLVEKAGVAPEVNVRNQLCAGEEARKRGNPPWL